jgi:SulP family sulfate permease
VIAITVMFLTPLFYFLPQTILAAIILVAVSNLLDFGTLKRLWGYDKGDAIAWCAAFIAVLATSVETGILIGAAISLALHLWRTSKPHIAIVGRIENTEHFRNIERYPVKTCPHILAIRIDESLYFANAKYLQTYVQNAIYNYPEVKHLVLICSAVNVIDGSGLETLKSLIEELKAVGIDFYLAEVKGPVLDKLKKIGFTEFIGSDRIFLTTDIAMKTLEGQ